MKLILLLFLTLFFSQIAYSSFHVENRHGGGSYGGGGYQHSHPNKMAPGDRFKDARQEERFEIYPEDVPVYTPTPKSQDRQDFEKESDHLRAYHREIKSKLDDAKNRIRGMERYYDREEMLEIAEIAHTESTTLIGNEQFQDTVPIYQKIAETLIDLSTSTLPVISWGRDLYEALTGKDLHTQEKLDDFSRAMAILGSVTVGFGSKAGKALNILKPFWDNSRLLRGDYWKAASAAKNIFEGKPLSELKKSLEFFKENKNHIKIPSNSTDEAYSYTKLVTAFKESKVTVLDKDVKAYRYYHSDYTGSRGQWLTTHKTPNPKSDLALPFPVNDVHEWTIPKGTKVLEGKVAPNFGEPGGGWQIFVPDMEVLN